MIEAKVGGSLARAPMYFSSPFDVYYYYSMQSLTYFSFGYCAIVEDPMAVASGICMCCC
jgi:hypothetical protein